MTLDGSTATVEPVVVSGALPVSVENWSEDILVVELQDDPAFSDDVTSVIDQVDGAKDVDVVLNLAGVNYLNSSNIAKPI